MKKLRMFLVLSACSALSCSLGCGGGSSHSATPTTPTTTPTSSTGSNVETITVNLGPSAADGFPYANGAFANVTVCVPGSTTSCQTIGGVLVDTGSVGLRLLSSVLTSISLPQQNSAGGSPVVECLQFLDSYTWGPVQMADIQIAGETASSVPIQVLSDTDFTAPTSCTNNSESSADTLDSLGANGILGVGEFPQDCGSTCPASANMYYECTSQSSCQTINESESQQVQNPVALFATDNNGVIMELPAVSGAETTVSGSLIFGIGTQSNNALGGATIYTADQSTGNFSTTFNGQSYASFIDSGSNGYFFQDNTIPQCSSSSGAGGFYCPSATVNLSATNQGTNAVSGTVDFSVANAETLFSNANDAVFSDLGGPASTAPPTTPGGSTIIYFDWGLPFFYGRNVYTAIEGTNAPSATPPYWAY